MKVIAIFSHVTCELTRQNIQNYDSAAVCTLSHTQARPEEIDLEPIFLQ